MGAVAVAAGAFGAHGLEGRVTAPRLEVWATGARYLMWHSLALLALILNQQDLFPWRWTLRAWSLGSCIFGGSLFALVLTDIGWLGAITPLGGGLLILGWLSLAWQAWKGSPN